MCNDITMKLADLISQDVILNQKSIVNIRKLIIDYISASYAGYRYNVQFNSAVENLYLNLHGDMEANVNFRNINSPVCTAAFLNAMYAHGADMDDGHRKAMGHIGASVLSAVFAMGEVIKTSQKKVIEAIAIGYEVHLQIASIAQPGIVQRGFHSTGVIGGIACAASCAKLLNLNKEQIASAISMAATQSSGLLIVGETGQLVKPLSPARAAEVGVFSTLIANQNILGPDRPLESINGWFHAMSVSCDFNNLFEKFEKFDAVNTCYVKPYPSCRHTHCGIEAGTFLHKKINYKEVKEVIIHTYRNAVNLAGKIRYPKNFDEAKFSIHYTFAVALFYGEFGLVHLDPNTVDSNIYKLIPKIKLEINENMESKENGIRGAMIEIENLNGEIFSKEILRPKGDPEVPFDMFDIEEKLKLCAGDMMTLNQQKDLINKIMSFGNEEIFDGLRIFDNFNTIE